MNICNHGEHYETPRILKIDTRYLRCSGPREIVPVDSPSGRDGENNICPNPILNPSPQMTILL
jgi:hypothetical protein